MAALTSLMATPLKPFNSVPHLRQPAPSYAKWPPNPSLVSNSMSITRFRTISRLTARRKAGAVAVEEEEDENKRRGLQVALWTAEGIYISWPFLLPYAPVGTFVLEIEFKPFLTNTFLIPYMAIRLNKAETSSQRRNRSQLEAVMTNGASVVGLIGIGVCLISVIWALFGRMDGNFGNIAD